MRLVQRLERLENMKDVKASQSFGRTDLTKVLEEIYQRVESSAMNDAWLRSQSNATVFAVALYGPFPWPDFVHERLNKESQRADVAGKLARSIVEAGSWAASKAD